MIKADLKQLQTKGSKSILLIGLLEFILTLSAQEKHHERHDAQTDVRKTRLDMDRQEKREADETN